jgi:hypothetical protein
MMERGCCQQKETIDLERTIAKTVALETVSEWYRNYAPIGFATPFAKTIQWIQASEEEKPLRACLHSHSRVDLFPTSLAK